MNASNSDRLLGICGIVRYSPVMRTVVYRAWKPLFRLAITVGTISLTSVAAVLAFGESSGAATSHSGPVDVLSARSLQELMQTQIGPAFQTATGYTLNNISMGSTALASSITGGILQGDVPALTAPMR
jgi:hypothetical protein